MCGKIARSIEAIGGSINAWTSFDQTVYHVVVPARFAEEGLDVLLDAVDSSVFDADELGVSWGSSRRRSGEAKTSRRACSVRPCFARRLAPTPTVAP